MTWFEDLTSCVEGSPAKVREQLFVEGTRLHSRTNGKSWQCGALETPTLGQLREKVRNIDCGKANRVREVVANVQHLHLDPANEHALFQVASQFNLLEMASPGFTPECGVGIYEDDYTQGPACAIAAGAGTIYRNYFVPVDGQIGQSADHQIDCLAGIGALLGNSQQRLWRMLNGYAMPSADALEEIRRALDDMDETSLGTLRQALQIGLHWDTQVTLDESTHTVSQAYCSAMPVRYTSHGHALWAPLATLILEAAYEATLCGGGCQPCSHQLQSIVSDIAGRRYVWKRCRLDIGLHAATLQLYADFDLEVAIVSYGASNRNLLRLASEFT